MIQQLRMDQNNYKILALDANDPNKQEAYGMSKIKSKCDMVDAYVHLHRDHEEFPTQQNGSKKIDHLICSPNRIKFITKIGYVKFNEAFDSDHRAIFCDISEEILENKCDIAVRKVRMVGTNSTNEEGENYVRYLYSRLQEHNIFKYVNELHESIQNKDLDSEYLQTIIKKLNVIDNTVTELKIKAEKTNCSKKDVAMWSPDLYQSNLRIQYLNIKRKSHQQQTNATKRLILIWNKMTDSSKEILENNTGTLTTQLKNAFNDHKVLVANNRELRLIYLQHKLDDLNERELETKHTTLETLIKRERKRADFVKLKTAFKQGNGKGITTLEVPNPNGIGYVTITEPSIINEQLLQRNISHFAQAQNTPFTVHPIQQWFEYEGTNSTVLKLLNNQITPPNTNELPIYVREILLKLADGNKLDEQPNTITYKEFIAGIIKWNERTTTSPSGRHLGHYKLLTRLNIYDEETKLINLSQQILTLYYKIAMIASTTGNSLERWCKVTTCMIEKMKGVPRIDKLRVIHIYKADYNLLLKIVWSRKGVWNCHTKGVLHEGQAGSRPGKRAIEVVVNKEMKYLYSRLTRTNLGTIDNDAKSCFDRILCNVAMPISGYFGIPLCFRQMQAKTLKNTRFKLSTAMGESQEDYRHSEQTPIHGTGQGSCSSPAIWLFISSFIMTILEKQSTGMALHDILKDKESILQWIEGFVDDTSIFANSSFHCNDIRQLKDRLQTVGTWWAGLLEATGGRLELEKCFYYLLTWKFNKNGSPQPEQMMEQFDNANKITLQHRNDSNTPLQQKDITDSHKTLGSYKTMSGEENDHFIYLLNKSNDFAERAVMGQLNRQQACLAYVYNYIPSLSYSLTAMCLSENQLERIQKKAVTQFVRIMGYDACFPRGVVYGPKKYGGLGLQQLFATSMTNKIECIIGNINCNNTLGKIMRINLNYLQLHSGKSIPVLNDKSPLTYIQDNWFLGINHFLNKINAAITINGIWKPTLLRKRDRILMEEVDILPISNNNKLIFNNWRLFFNINNLSEITNAAGTKVLSTVLTKSEINNYERNSKIRWPIQAQPHVSTFHIWKSILHEICGIQLNGYLKNLLENGRKIHTKLGNSSTC